MTADKPPAAEPANGREVLERALAALGGADQIERVQSWVVTGKVEVLGGFVGRYQSWAQAPDKLKTRWDIGYIQQERAFDGRHGWEKHASPRELAGRDLARLQRQARFQPLLAYWRAGIPATLKGQENAENRPAYAVEFRPTDGTPEIFYFDAETFLPLRETRLAPYEEGDLPVTTSFGNWQQVGDVWLPFSLREQRPDVPLSITVERYDVNVPLDDALFAYPVAVPARAPYEVTLATIPRRIYKESDALRGEGWQRFWGIAFGPTESWVFNLVVEERYGRWVEPTEARVELYAGPRLVKSVAYPRESLRQLEKFPVTRFAPQPESFDFRHYFSEPAALGIDRMVYRLRLEAPTGQRLEARLDIPLETYRPKKKLLFPVRGPFIVTGGHDFNELGHKYEWSQHYGYDIVGLGPTLEFTAHRGQAKEDFYAFGRVEILVPADGVVVYARNDVPDDMLPRDYLKLRDPLHAVGGNIVLIDHGEGEVSLLAHMQQGSVRVRAGERVRPGQVIGLMGCSGSPGFPHLHYQLQADATLFGTDGLPSRFENLETLRGEPVPVPKRGIYLVAK